eukprot:5524912-Alexandrium_andersonii.AAC.1
MSWAITQREHPVRAGRGHRLQLAEHVAVTVEHATVPVVAGVRADELFAGSEVGAVRLLSASA